MGVGGGAGSSRDRTWAVPVPIGTWGPDGRHTLYRVRRGLSARNASLLLRTRSVARAVLAPVALRNAAAGSANPWGKHPPIARPTATRAPLRARR